METSASNSANLAKRATEDDLIGTSRKLSKVEQPAEDDFAASVRKKLSASSRTGQACDRCKVRKIKCDGSPQGCSPCRQSQHVCQTTDRNNGRTTIRGHTDKLEWENKMLREKIRRYEKYLKENGIPFEEQRQSVPAFTTPIYDRNNSISNASPPWQGGQDSSSPTASKTYRAPAVDMEGSAPQHTSLTLLNGTVVSLFGMQIDVAKFTDSKDDKLAPAAYETFLRYVFRREEAPAPDLPGVDDCNLQVFWFFRSMSPYVPFLHKPDFVNLVTKVYDVHRTEPLSAADDVMIHILFAVMKYQNGQRNNVPDLLEEAFAHYKYSLTRFHELLEGHSLVKIQALLFIFYQVRNFPKPGAAWFCAHIVMAKALELNMHRSASRLPAEQRNKMTNHEIEMRKRVFWTIYSLSTNIGVKLGQPPLIHLEEIDLEMPLPFLDEETSAFMSVPTKAKSNLQKCSYYVGNAVFKMNIITGKLHTSLFGVRRNAQVYSAEVGKLEAELETWKRELPEELRDPETAIREWMVFAYYVQFWELELRFFLRHPVIHASTNPELFATNAEITLETCDKYRIVVGNLHALRAIDIPWINTTGLLAVLFTTLFLQDKRQEEITQDELTKLESDMAGWINVLQDVGRMLGTGNELAKSTRMVVENSLTNIRRRMVARNAAAVVAKTLTPTAEPDIQSASVSVASIQPEPASTPVSVALNDAKTQHPINGYNQADLPSVATIQSTYLPTSQAPPFNYAQPSMDNPQNFQRNSISYSQPIFAPQMADAIRSQSVPMPPPVAPTPQNVVSAYQMADIPTAMYYAAQATHPATPAQLMMDTPANDWLRWGAATLNAYPLDGTREYANALVALGGGGLDATQDVMQTGTATGTLDADVTNWPMSQFHMGQPGQNG